MCKKKSLFSPLQNQIEFHSFNCSLVFRLARSHGQCKHDFRLFRGSKKRNFEDKLTFPLFFGRVQTFFFVSIFGIIAKTRPLAFWDTVFFTNTRGYRGKREASSLICHAFSLHRSLSPKLFFPPAVSRRLFLSISISVGIPVSLD